nr:MAG TPA: hypothetical protein [Caudoviricetes sp.]
MRDVLIDTRPRRLNRCEDFFFSVKINSATG